MELCDLRRRTLLEDSLVERVDIGCLDEFCTVLLERS